MKNPIQNTYFIALSIVALLVIFIAIWFSFYIAKNITTPISNLIEGTKKIAKGDLSYRIETQTEDEIAELVKSFNKMTSDLKKGRLHLSLSEKKLIEQNEELARNNQYIEIILQNVAAGVISINADGVIVTMNKSAEKAP